MHPKHTAWQQIGGVLVGLGGLAMVSFAILDVSLSAGKQTIPGWTYCAIGGGVVAVLVGLYVLSSPITGWPVPGIREEISRRWRWRIPLRLPVEALPLTSTSEQASTPNAATTPEDRLDRVLREQLEAAIPDIPLTPGERSIVMEIMKEARHSAAGYPFVSGQPGNPAIDVIDSTKRRRPCPEDDCNNPGEQMWNIQTTFRGIGDNGILRSDETVQTLYKLHGAILALRQWAYDQAHPPVSPK